MHHLSDNLAPLGLAEMVCGIGALETGQVHGKKGKLTGYIDPVNGGVRNIHGHLVATIDVRPVSTVIVFHHLVVLCACASNVLWIPP